MKKGKLAEVQDREHKSNKGREIDANETPACGVTERNTRYLYWQYSPDLFKIYESPITPKILGSTIS